MFLRSVISEVKLTHCRASQLTGFYMIATSAFNKLIATFAGYQWLLCLTENHHYLYQVLLILHYCLPQANPADYFETILKNFPQKFHHLF